jgi:5-methyltetrahydropteroyltriglutamate--homocysteine methyltransferase
MGGFEMVERKEKFHLTTTNVGSIPKPDYVRHVDGWIHEDTKRGIEENINIQREIGGLDEKNTGEVGVKDMVSDAYVGHGYDVETVRSHDNRFYDKGLIDRRIEPIRPMKLEIFEFANSLLVPGEVVKEPITGPTTYANWGFNSRRIPLADVAKEWAISHTNIEALAQQDAGAKIIQIDEPAYVEKGWNEDLLIEPQKLAVKGLDPAKVKRVIHICYSDYSKIYDILKTLPYDELDLETSADLDQKELSPFYRMMRDDPLTKYKRVKFGVVDPQPHVDVEPVELIEKRIWTALDVAGNGFDPDYVNNISIGADCGYRVIKLRKKAFAKMKNMSIATYNVNEQLNRLYG